MWFASKTATAAPRLLLLGFLAAACAAPPPPKAKPAAAPEPTPEATPSPAPTPEPAPTPNTVVLDSGGEKGGSATSLADAARAAREQKAHAAPPAHVITDKNIKQYAAKGQITVATPAKKTEVEAEEATPVRDEQYWRSRALEVRLRWRKAADDVKELEQSAAGWRRRFYAENDPYVRSGQVKPEWDRVLDRLEEARAEAETAKAELAELLEEGRTAGALPGWLREGVDEEPKEETEPEGLKEHKAIEPPKVEEDGR
jgi:hypothetical protein